MYIGDCTALGALVLHRYAHRGIFCFFARMEIAEFRPRSLRVRKNESGCNSLDGLQRQRDLSLQFFAPTLAASAEFIMFFNGDCNSSSSTLDAACLLVFGAPNVLVSASN